MLVRTDFWLTSEPLRSARDNKAPVPTWNLTVKPMKFNAVLDFKLAARVAHSDASFKAMIKVPVSEALRYA